MKTYILWLKGPAVKRYWNSGAQTWTTDHGLATRFGSMGEAYAATEDIPAETLMAAEVIIQEISV